MRRLAVYTEVLCSGLWAALTFSTAEAKSVTISSAANITQCLSSRRGNLILEDCVRGIGAEWNWTVDTAPQLGHLKLAGYAAQAAEALLCLGDDLVFRRCDGNSAQWRWNPRTLQIQLHANGKVWCLGLIGKELLVGACHELKGTTSDDQNGYGAPAEQTWVLLPVDRPQISILDNLEFPLWASGRHIIDSKGHRVKMAGINWVGAHMEMLVNNGLAVSTIRRIARTIKYMGFNSVRLSYASRMHMRDVHGKFPAPPDQQLLSANPELKGLSAMEIFDKTVEAITQEGLLVVLSRRMQEPGWCCSGDDGSELWYGDNFTVEDWMDSLTFMARRYADNKRVIGHDIFSEPRMRDSDGTIPWWGVESSATKFLGFKLADWRQAAAKGAVAVWHGNPNALVFVEGQLYASNFEHVRDRPLKFAKDCLQSRVVFASHEYHWHWNIDQMFLRLMDAVRPWYSTNVKSVLHEVAEAGQADEFGNIPSTSLKGTGPGSEFSYSSGDALISYETWADARNKGVFFLQNSEDVSDHAPVLVSEFGTSRKGDNAWWEYILQYFREYDVNWCYWALDAITVPKNFQGKDAPTVQTYGVFDPSRRDYSAVVGWKLQDLVGIMAPGNALPSKVDAPVPCSFDYAPNLAAASEATSVMELLRTMRWNPREILEVVLFLALAGLLPAICCLGVALTKHRSSTQRTLSREEEACCRGGLFGVGGKAGTLAPAPGRMIDAAPMLEVSSPPPAKGNFLMCCSRSSKPPANSRSQLQATAYARVASADVAAEMR